MKTIVFDIETIPVNFDTLDEDQQIYLTKFANTDEEKEKTKDQMALWALTNRIVAIGMLSVEDQKGAVYFQSGDKTIAEFEDKDIKYSCGNEAEILEKFWHALSFANRFVTFNGRGFDCPVLMLRSAINHVKCARNLMPYRYATDAHVDLLEQLTFYGAYRKFNLDFYTKSFGIKSPKADGVTGHDVKPLFESGEYEKIARYCAGDLFATRELYLRWKEYMNVK